MAKSIERFKQSTKRMRGGKGRAARYPDEARAWAVKYAEGQMAKGEKVSALAGRLGISDMTLRSWLYSASRKGAGALCEVVVAEAVPVPPARGITVTTAAGHVVGGLDLEGAAALLKAIG